MPADPNRVQAVFLAAVELPDADAQVALLDRECGSDAALRDRVERLLAAHREDSFLGTPAGGAVPAVGDAIGTVSLPIGTATGMSGPAAHRPESTAAADRDPDGATGTFGSTTPRRERPTAVEPGTVIAGRYTLVEVIGEGGMGTVFLASQTEPVKRPVALKLIKTGMDSRAVLARFDAERQALALMDHPNVARVYDGGTTPAGQPFFVMELVSGVPLTDYCDTHRLTVDARLELFVAVCQAVQHAHQKGIIHRDLKPGNVLVTKVDGRPTPKVIDFGVAKATGVPLTDQSFADTGAIVGTPAYMSPEQADPTSMDIDTRTDVYALGVMLYELLTGSPPIDGKQFKQGAILEMLRMVREVEPPRPSTKLSTADALTNIAANRSIEPAKLAKLLRGELDWVVMKALEKDRDRRYDSANGFAADVQRYLRGEQVQAVPPSLGYRLRKAYRRNRAAVLTVATVVLMLVGGVAGTTWGMVRASAAREAEAAEKERAVRERDEARRQRTRTRAVVDAMMSEQGVEWFSVWKSMTPEQRAYLTDLVARYRELVADDATDAEALALAAGASARMGKLLFALGQPDDASAAFRAARDLYARATAAEPGRGDWAREWAEVEVEAVFFLLMAGQTEEAAAAVRGAVERAERVAARDPAGEQALAAALSAEGGCHAAAGRTDLARDRHARATDVWRRLVARHSAEPKFRKALADNLTLRAGLLSSVEAEPLFAEALRIREQLYRDAPGALILASDLGDSCLSHGLLLSTHHKRPAEALEFHNAAISFLRPAHDLGVPALLRMRLQMAYRARADLLYAAERFQEAARDYERALELAEEADRPPLQYNMARVLYRALQPDRALAASEEAAGTGCLSGEQVYELAFWAAFTANTLLTPAQRDRAAGTAVGLLRKAVAAGYRSLPGFLDNAPWHGPIRLREDFRAAYKEITGAPPAPPGNPKPAPAPVGVLVPLPAPAREVAPPPREKK